MILLKFDCVYDDIFTLFLLFISDKLNCDEFDRVLDPNYKEALLILLLCAFSNYTIVNDILSHPIPRFFSSSLRLQGHIVSNSSSAIRDKLLRLEGWFILF